MPLKIVDVKWQNDGPSNPNGKLALVRELVDCFTKAVAARQSQIEEKYRRAIKNYDAVPSQPIRSKPFSGASNFMPQLIKLHTDILTARVVGIILGTRPIWMPRTSQSETRSEFEIALSECMQYISLFRMKFPELVDQIVFRGFKGGTVVTKDYWDEEALSGGEGSTLQWKRDFKVAPIAFEDFYPYPLTSLNLDQCEIKFQRLHYTERMVQSKKSTKLWDEKACNLLLRSREGTGATSSQQLALQNVQINIPPDLGAPFAPVEAHLNWEFTPGIKTPIICVFNPKAISEDSLLRCYYKPDADLFSSPFTDFRFFNSDQNFYCTSIPAILEDSQEEQAQIHNARRDASLIANVPGWKKKRYADVANPNTEWYPGKVFELEDINDLGPLEFTGNYNSLVDEESFLLQLCERYTGITPAAQGQGSGVNGQVGYANTGTLAMISEGNRRQDTYIKRARLPFHNIGSRCYKSYRDFGDPDELRKQFGIAGQLVETIFQQDAQLAGGGAFWELACSDAGANRETERSGLLLMANTMSAYYHELVQAAQMVSATPDGTPAKELLLQVLDGARDLANRILFVFDIGGREQLLPDLRKVLAGGTPPGGMFTGSPAAGPSAALPPSQGPVSPSDIQQLSQQLTSLTRQGNQGRTQ